MNGMNTTDIPSYQSCHPFCLAAHHWIAWYRRVCRNHTFSLRNFNFLIMLFTVLSYPITEECMYSPHMSNWQPAYITEHELQNCDRKNYKNHGSLLRPEESSLTRPWLRFRKLPGRNVYAQMHNEKEQEMTSPVNHSEDTQNIIQGEEFIDDDLDSQTLGNAGGRSKFTVTLN